MPRKRDHLELVEPRDRAEWRAWLEGHHATSQGVWLAIGKKGNTRTALTYEEAVEQALCYGWIDSVVNRLDGHRFKQLVTPRKTGGTWARSNRERVERLMSQGLMAPAGLAAIEAAKADGTWTILEDVEALIVPDDLAIALAANPTALANFEAFPDSAKKLALWWIRSAKRPETQAKRVTETVRLAADNRRASEQGRREDDQAPEQS
jgi:uncharacterized protein YdeI (YjbR/CyaY-like superfamily)